jgi:hypothetical protein
MLGMIILLLLLGVLAASGGDTFDCINSRGDYINYGPPAAPRATEIVVVPASTPRWTDPMLSPDDLRALIFLRAASTRQLVIGL